jgi:ATP-dependent DNA helicase RecG
MSATSPAIERLLSSVQYLKGVGPRSAPRLQRLGTPRVIDLLWHLPYALIDRRQMPQIGDLSRFAGQTVTLDVMIAEHRLPLRRGLPFKAVGRDKTGTLDIVYFGGRAGIWQKSLPIGANKIISGKIDYFAGRAQMVHPDYVADPGDLTHIRQAEPYYPLTDGVSNKYLRQILAQALPTLPNLPEWLDKTLLQSTNWPSWQAAIQAIHAPKREEDLQPTNPARVRLAYDEILSHQLALALLRQSLAPAATAMRPARQRDLRELFLKNLPFALTEAQKTCLREIDQDMQTPQPMLRLLQGDVGSGKTVVAVASLLNAIERGQQAALMAPTEILARQHEKTLSPWLEAIGLRVATLTGRDKGKARQNILRDLRAGQIDLLIGTHALIEDGVKFQNLGAVAIDEQHRFGVEQRLRLSHKGGEPDLLVMTATPIPRSLYLALYGDLATSRVSGKPPGRQPIDTRTIAIDRLDEVIEGLKRAIGEGQQVYWVCPLVHESELSDLAAAEARYAELKQIFGAQIGILHGQQTAKVKDAAMQDFIAGKTRIMISTTVIEVGVDVPNATIMVIDHAERFGLAQLHQLRGRVGRSDKKSSCILLYSYALSSVAKSRLQIMRETEDGFLIAEEDLKLRGAGEILGKRQSGLPGFRLADFQAHQDLFKTAQRDVQHIMHQDPYLLSERGHNLRLLLRMFGRENAAWYVQSG